DAVYVIALVKQYPHETPPLDQISERVTSDYKQSQALMLARQEGVSNYQIFTNRLAQGHTFVSICDQAKMTMIHLAPFSLSTTALGEIENLVSVNHYKQAALNTPPGKVSPFQPTSTGGMLLYVKEKLPVNTAKMETDLPGYVSNLRATRQSEAFNEWLRKEAEKGLRDTPAGRPTPPPAVGTAAKS